MQFPFFSFLFLFLFQRTCVFLEMCSVNSHEMRKSPLLYFAFPTFQIVVVKNKQLWKSVSPFEGQKHLFC